MGPERDPYELAAIEKLRVPEPLTSNEIGRIANKIEWGAAIRGALHRLTPGEKLENKVYVRSLALSLREKDKQIFFVLKATIDKGLKAERNVVGFHSSEHLAPGLYEFSERIRLGSVKWREDVPWTREDPNDAIEGLPKWGDSEHPV